MDLSRRAAARRLSGPHVRNVSAISSNESPSASDARRHCHRRLPNRRAKRGRPWPVKGPGTSARVSIRARASSTASSGSRLTPAGPSRSLHNGRRVNRSTNSPNRRRFPSRQYDSRNGPRQSACCRSGGRPGVGEKCVPRLGYRHLRPDVAMVVGTAVARPEVRHRQHWPGAPLIKKQEAGARCRAPLAGRVRRSARRRGSRRSGPSPRSRPPTLNARRTQRAAALRANRFLDQRERHRLARRPCARSASASPRRTADCRETCSASQPRYRRGRELLREARRRHVDVPRSGRRVPLRERGSRWRVAPSPPMPGIASAVNWIRAGRHVPRSRHAGTGPCMNPFSYFPFLSTRSRTSSAPR